MWARRATLTSRTRWPPSTRLSPGAVAPTATSAGASSQASVACYLAANPTATMVDFATNGLDSGGTLPILRPHFPEIIPRSEKVNCSIPIGDSRYDALQMSLRSNVEHPFRGVRR